jgi:prepilin-type N-terminal cleavage/methylation domain-containing protein
VDAVTLTDERGFSLIELLVVMTLSLVVLSATLLTFTALSNSAHDNNVRLETTEVARDALDVQARQLRNLAKRLNNTAVLDTVAPYDLIFQTSDPSRTWVRYCLDTVHPPATSDQARLWTQERALASAAASPVTAAMRVDCPSTSADWTATRVVAEQLTHRRGGLDRPLFTYRCTSGTTCTSDPATYDQVININALTIVDTDADRELPELRVTSGVFLRNQNQAPVARFVATPASTSGTIVLNASASTDYEGRTLNYYWFVGARPAVASIDCANPMITGNGVLRTLWGAAGYAGESITLSYTFSAAERLLGSTANVGLVVCDPGDRFGTAGITSTIPVQIPS